MVSETIGVSLVMALTILFIALIAGAVLSLPSPEPIRSLDTVSTCVSGSLSCLP